MFFNGLNGGEKLRAVKNAKVDGAIGWPQIPQHSIGAINYKFPCLTCGTYAVSAAH